MRGDRRGSDGPALDLPTRQVVDRDVNAASSMRDGSIRLPDRPLPGRSRWCGGNGSRPGKLTHGGRALEPSTESGLPEGTVTSLHGPRRPDEALPTAGDGGEPDPSRSRAVCAELIDRHRASWSKHGRRPHGRAPVRPSGSYARELQLAVADRNRSQPAQQVLMRIGLHTGEVIAQSGDLHGETVYIA